jgi:hypothetical protein
MPQVDIPFPKSSMPGQRPGEGQGRLINCFCEVDGNVLTWRAVPGLKRFADTLGSGPRGSIVRGSYLFVAMRDAAYAISLSGTVSQVSGTIDGSKPVTWAQNNRSPTPDLIVVTENDVYSVSNTSALPLGQPNLPRPNSVSQLDGYLLFTIQDGRVFERGVVYVANIEEVPNAVAHHLANMLGLFLMADFGASAGSVNLPPQDSTETALRRLTAVKPIFTTLRADYS